jgi:integrase
MAQVTIKGKKVSRHRCKTKKEAQQWEREEREGLLKGQVVPQKTLSVSLLDWANAYLDYAQKQFVFKTWEEKRFAFRLLFQSVDPNILAEDLNSIMVLKHLQIQEKSRSGHAANKDRKNLRAAWEWGIKFLGLPDKNSFHMVGRFAEERDERHVPTLDDFWKVYAVADTDQDRLMLFMYLSTGARRDELFRLRWKDMDFNGRRVIIRFRKNNIGEWKESYLPISDELIGMLKQHQKVTGLLGFVFMYRTDDEKYVPYQYRQHWLGKLCEKSGVTKFGFHGIRHLFASILASKNVPLVEIQKMLRHGSIQTTARYIHSLQEGSREAIAALPGLKGRETKRKVA